MIAKCSQESPLLAEAVTGNKTTPMVTLRQFHSNLVVIAGAGDANSDRPRKADGVITAEPGLPVAIQTADCIPVLVADRNAVLSGRSMRVGGER